MKSKVYILNAQRNAAFLKCNFFLDSHEILHKIVSCSFLLVSLHYEPLKIKLRQHEFDVTC